MKKYFDNILFFLQKSGGGSVYWGELMKRFNAYKSNGATFIQPDAETANIILPTLNLNPVIYEKKIPLPILRYLPLSVSLSEPGIFHSSYYRYTTQKEIPNFVTVHDFIYEKFRTGIAKMVHTRQKAASIKHAKGIVCISESTQKDLLKYYPNLTDKKKIRVIYNGVSEDFTMVANEERKDYEHYSYFTKHKCLLFIGHRTHYKNFDFATYLVEALPKEFRLVIVGNPLTMQESKMLNSKLKERFLFLGNTSNSQLNYIYNLSYCLLYPSSYEGFGIPILEAYRCSCPVVGQNVSAIHEISVNTELLSNNLSIFDFKKNILALENSNLRSEITLAGYNWSLQFSWDKCYNELNNFYEDCK